jgi:tRNA pseudouridine38-40 synthase
MHQSFNIFTLIYAYLGLSYVTSYATTQPFIRNRFKIWSTSDEEFHSNAINRFRYRARVMYDGTDFKGWQGQGKKEDVRTVQQTINNVLTTRFGYPVSAVGGGRTDAGVHADGQCIHFDLLDSNIDLEELQHSVNQMLPLDVKLYNMTSIFKSHPNEKLWHATGSALEKLYVYKLCTNDFIIPQKCRFYSRLTRPTDMDKLHEALQIFTGTHNFSSFTNRFERNSNALLNSGYSLDPMRTIRHIELLDIGHGYFHINVYVKSALYKMIRNVVGSAVDVASGRVSLDSVRSLLTADIPLGRVQNKARTAPAHGLTLEHISYSDY